MLQPGQDAPEIKTQAFMPNGTFKEVSLADFKVKFYLFQNAGEMENTLFRKQLTVHSPEAIL
jgi:hypothetical protein